MTTPRVFSPPPKAGNGSTCANCLILCSAPRGLADVGRDKHLTRDKENTTTPQAAKKCSPWQDRLPSGFPFKATNQTCAGHLRMCACVHSSDAQWPLEKKGILFLGWLSLTSKKNEKELAPLGNWLRLHCARDSVTCCTFGIPSRGLQSLDVLFWRQDEAPPLATRAQVGSLPSPYPRCVWLRAETNWLHGELPNDLSRFLGAGGIPQQEVQLFAG